MNLVQETKDQLILKEIAKFLHAFWDIQDFPNGRPDLAYRSLTTFLLGIRLVDRFGANAVLESNICPIRFSADQYEVTCLSKWIFRTHNCFGVVGFKGMEALLDPFYWMNLHLNHDQRLRTVDDTVYGMENWVSNSCALAALIDNFGRLDALRQCCLSQARKCEDWLTLGLANLDIWWNDEGQGGLPGNLDVMSISMTSGYTNTPVERIGIAHLLENLKRNGLSDGWEGDLEAAANLAYAGGRSLYQESPEVFNSLLEEFPADGEATGWHTIGALVNVLKRSFGSTDPLQWDEIYLKTTLNFIQREVKIPYLYQSINEPNQLRCAVDFAFWAGLLSTALEEDMI